MFVVENIKQVSVAIGQSVQQPRMNETKKKWWVDWFHLVKKHFDDQEEFFIVISSIYFSVAFTFTLHFRAERIEMFVIIPFVDNLQM